MTTKTKRVRRNAMSSSMLRAALAVSRMGARGRGVPRRVDRIRRATLRWKLGSKLKTQTTHTSANELPNRAGTESTFKIILKPKGLLNKLEGKLQNSVRTIASDTVVTTTAGVQNYMEPGTGAMFGATHLNLILGEVGTLTGFAGDYRQNAINCFLKSAFQEFMFTNSTNAVVRIQVWDCIAKRDGYTDRYGSAASPGACWADGMKEQTSGGTGNEFKVVGARPTDSNLFNKFWKVKKVTYTDLAPGQVHYHRIHYRINRRISNDIVQNTNLFSVKGMTVSPLFVFYGNPVGDGSGGATTEAARINCVHSMTYHFTYLQASTSIVQQNNNLLTATTGNLENLVTGASAAYAAVT